SAFISQMSPPRSKTIRVPSGEKLGERPAARTVFPVPSAFTSEIPAGPLKSSFVPSGDQFGSDPVASRRSLPPAAATVKPPYPEPSQRVNASVQPPGAHTGEDPAATSTTSFLR